MKKKFIGLILSVVVLSLNNAIYAQTLPAAHFTDGGVTAICSGTTVTFNSSTTTGSPAPTFLWNFGDGVTSTLANPTHTYTTTASKTITVTLTATNGLGNNQTSTTITVNPNLPASVKITDNATSNTICNGVSVTFTATPTNGGTPTYQWDTNGVSVSGATGATWSPTYLKNGDIVKCIMTEVGETCPTGSPATSNTETMTVHPNLPASVSIAATATAICAGTDVTFTATPTNGGSAPTYKWYDNATLKGSGATYASTTLANNDTIKCILTSNATCVTGSPATSNKKVMTVTATVTPTISIADSGATSNTICTGSKVAFTATVTNQGTTPIYQWYNGTTTVGSNSNIYRSAALANASAIKCMLTSNVACPSKTTATSNIETMTVHSYPVSVSITDNAASNTICAGTSVKFTAVGVNGGSSPIYEWDTNGRAISGQTASTFTATFLKNTDVVKCKLTSDETCATGSPATSNGETMTVEPDLPASVAITSSPAAVSGTTSITSGTSVTFTATATNGGLTPKYQWYLNGAAISGAIYTTWTSETLTNNSLVKCVMTSDATPCLTGSPATSNVITMDVTAGSIRGAVERSKNGEEFQIFPNPAKGTLYVNANCKSLSDVTITLTNTVGKTVLVKKLDNNVTTALDVADLSEGIYFVKFQSNDIVNMQKVIITK
jgi:hypothetical protein